MTKYRLKCSEELTSKNRAYWCWLCDTRNVKWNGKVFTCKKCSAEHKTVMEVILAQPKENKEI